MIPIKQPHLEALNIALNICIHDHIVIKQGATYTSKIWGMSYNGGFPQQTHGVFLLKMIILGCEMGVPPFTETSIYTSVLFEYIEVKLRLLSPDFHAVSNLQIWYILRELLQYASAAD